MARLTQKERDVLPASDFAVPGKRKLLIQDESHVRFAWDEVSRTEGLTADERAEARRRIIERARKLGVDTTDWQKIKAVRFELESLEAMSLAVPETPEHPNKAPFTGILVKIDRPSDKPPLGAFGKRIVMTSAAAEAAIPSLLGMGVDYTPDLDGHDPKAKIGIITAGRCEGENLEIEGFFYAHDFPEVIARIRADKAAMGFSFEADRILVEDMEADPLVITACVFTGAAVLQKDKAAYTTTRLAANAAPEEHDMTKEELDALMTSVAAIGTKVGEIGAKVETLGTEVAAVKASQGETAAKLAASQAVIDKVEPHAKRLMDACEAMRAAGIGTDSKYGHAGAVERIAGHMRAEAAQGRMPSVFHYYEAAGDHRSVAAAAEPDPKLKEIEGQLTTVKTELGGIKDLVAGLGTKLTDIQAAAVKAASAPERKTLPPSITALLAKANITLPTADGEKMDVRTLDTALGKTNFTVQQKLQLKGALAAVGLLA